MKKTLLSLFIALFMLGNFAFAQKIEKQKFNWGINDQDTTAGYTQATKVDNVIYISGTVAKDVNPDGIKRVYDALQKTLEFYGVSFANVVKENLFTTDIEAMKQYNYVRKAYYKNDFPSATWVQVSRLYMSDARLEVELVAHLPL